MIAIITARKGSKRLPNKNKKNMLGKPLIVHTIEAAKEAKLITRIIVSTDDQEIRDISIAAGAEVPFVRPDNVSTDTASSRDVLLHAIDEIDLSGKDKITELCLLQPTSPLRKAHHIDAAIEIFRSRQADSVISVTSYEHPPQWALSINDDGSIKTDGELLDVLRNSKEKFLRPNGAIYIFNTDFLKNSKSFYSKNTFPFLMDTQESIDIDNITGFKICELIINKEL